MAGAVDCVQPDALVDITLQLPIACDTIAFLINGVGSYVPGNTLADKLASRPILRQFEPWPGKVAPPPSVPRSLPLLLLLLRPGQG